MCVLFSRFYKKRGRVIKLRMVDTGAPPSAAAVGEGQDDATMGSVNNALRRQLYEENQKMLGDISVYIYLFLFLGGSHKKGPGGV